MIATHFVARHVYFASDKQGFVTCRQITSAVFCLLDAGYDFEITKHPSTSIKTQ